MAVSSWFALPLLLVFASTQADYCPTICDSQLKLCNCGHFNATTTNITCFHDIPNSVCQKSHAECLGRCHSTCRSKCVQEHDECCDHGGHSRCCLFGYQCPGPAHDPPGTTDSCELYFGNCLNNCTHSVSPIGQNKGKVLALSGTKLVMPLTWAPEPQGGARLTFVVSVLMQTTGKWVESVSRVDLGNLKGLMLSTDTCKNCNEPCTSAGYEGMPHSLCPGGAAPLASHQQSDGHGRTIVPCPASDVGIRIGGQQFTVSKSVFGPAITDHLLYMTKATRCGQTAVPNTGFGGVSPFLHALYNQVGSQTLTLQVRTPSISVGANTSSGGPAVVTPWVHFGHHAGRAVQINAINGKPIDVLTTTIDTGNGAFVSYGPGSPLSAAKKFPFTVTFVGGGTLTFHSAPTVQGKTTRAAAYSHDVLALGFLAPYDVTFDDAKKTVAFIAPSAEE